MLTRMLLRVEVSTVSSLILEALMGGLDPSFSILIYGIFTHEIAHPADEDYVL